MNSNGFANKHLSVSRLRRFESCPLSFKLHYVDQLKAEPNDALRFGSLLHAVLERLYRWVVDEEFAGRIEEARALEVYREEWQRSGLSGFAVFQEGVDILHAYLGEHGEVDHRNVLAVEQEFRLPAGAFEVLGYIDRVDRIDDETIAIIDYKTNRLIFTRDEVDSDFQLTVYLMAARQLWPWAAKVRLVFHLLRHGIQMETERTEAQVEAARDYIIALGRQTEAAIDYPARLNANCSYCDHRNQCPAYRDAVAGRVEVVRSSPDDLEAVAREREQVAHLAKILYARKAELEEVLKAQLEGRDTLELAGVVYQMSRATQASYPVGPTLAVLEELAGLAPDRARDRLLVVDKGRLDALVKDLARNMNRAKHRMLKAHLDAVAEKTVVPRFYAKEVR
ncbi:MAG: PD-(D/E)XK nuclease family protein [Deltaproteobacteria bacterium]|nr:PD-(D/E)XK nuclease family protein [Deltaproteobacteria bacterium]